MPSFQSTRPRGARLLLKSSPCNIYRFNPRARVGRDVASRTLCPRCEEFQSTRPRGARRRADDAVRAKRVVSIHAPAWGAT